MTIITDERCVAYRQPGHPERPERISATLARLRAREGAWNWAAPAVVEPAALLRAHSTDHLERLGAVRDAFDADTPAHPGIFDHALRGVGGAMKGLALARGGTQSFCLLRPPGHHATRTRAMGFCYLSTAAIAALEARATGTGCVAIFDFDVHHGNGTEAIVAGKRGIYFASVHQHPCYPGTGTEDVATNCFNHPVPPSFPRREYRAVLTKAFERLLAQKPGLLVVSAGFDAYAHDPIAQETLEAEDFHWLGARVREAGVPAFSVLEGGYSADLPALVIAYLDGVAGR